MGTVGGRGNVAEENDGNQICYYDVGMHSKLILIVE